MNLKSFKLKIDGEEDTDKGKFISKIKTTYYIDADNEEKEINRFVELIEKYCKVENTIINTPKFEKEIVIL